MHPKRHILFTTNMIVGYNMGGFSMAFKFLCMNFKSNCQRSKCKVLQIYQGDVYNILFFHFIIITAVSGENLQGLRYVKTKHKTDAW